MTLHGRADSRDWTHVVAVPVQTLHLLEMLFHQLEHLASPSGATLATRLDRILASGKRHLLVEVVLLVSEATFLLQRARSTKSRHGAPAALRRVYPQTPFSPRGKKAWGKHAAARTDGTDGASSNQVEPGQRHHRVLCAKEQARTPFVVARTFSSCIFCISSCCSLKFTILARISAEILAVSIR